MGLARAEDFEFDRKAWLKEYDPHDGQWAYHSSNARFRVIVAGRRWGKSLSAAKEAEAMILTPGTRGWVVSKTYDLTEKVIREIHRDLIINLRLEDRLVKHRTAPSFYMEFDWGSVVEGKSAAHPESLLGEGLDWLIFDECAKCKSIVWEQYLRPTLTDREGWALFITTPSGYNWIYDLWKRGNAVEYSDWESFQSPSWVNPHLSKEDLKEAQETLSENIWRQEFGAEFTVQAGLIYTDYDVIGDEKWPAMLDELIYGLDFGFNNPTALLEIGFLDNEIFERELIYESYIKTPQLVEMMKEAGIDENDYIYADPSRPDIIEELCDAGFTVIPAYNDVAAGIGLVQSKRPKLHADSLNLLAEKEMYKWKENKDGKSLDEPVKDWDHLMDAERYALFSHLGGTRPAIFRI